MDVAQQIQELRQQIGRAVVGQDEVVEEIVVCMLAGGHALLEGAPGLGKTLLVRTLADCLRLRFSRIQFTPDLMPADITGTEVIQEDKASRCARDFKFLKARTRCSPTSILADEINRTPPKTQSRAAGSDAGVTR